METGSGAGPVDVHQVSVAFWLKLSGRSFGESLVLQPLPPIWCFNWPWWYSDFEFNNFYFVSLFPSKSSKGDASPPAQDTPFFTVAPQKGKDAAPKGARKARIRARTRVAIKARVKGKVMIGKGGVDRTRSWGGSSIFSLSCIFGMLLLSLAAIYCACSFFRGTFSSQKKCLFLAPWKISGMINI